MTGVIVDIVLKKMLCWFAGWVKAA